MVRASVVIPTYNRADRVGDAIDSALNQTLADREVIVVDDASSDSTAAVLRGYGDRITHLTHEENRGGSAARNTGIEASSGEYIAFLDSDDTWEPDKLEKQIQELERRSDKWVAAYCDFRQTRSNRVVETVDNLVRRPTGFEGDEEIIDRIFLRQFAHGGASTLLVKRSAVEAIDGFDPSFQRHQDLEFLVRLLQVGKLAYVDETLVYKHDTGNPPLDTVRTAMEQFNETFEDLIRARGLANEVGAVQQFMISKWHLRNGDFEQAFENLRHSTCPHYRDLVSLGLATVVGLRKKIQ